MRTDKLMLAMEQALRIIVADRPDLKEKLQEAADEATEYEVWNLLGSLADCCPNT